MGAGLPIEIPGTVGNGTPIFLMFGRPILVAILIALVLRVVSLVLPVAAR